DPVEILDERHAQLSLTVRLDDAPRDGEQPTLERLRVHGRRRALWVGHPQEIEDEGELLAQPLIEEHEAPGDLLARDLLGVAPGDAEEGAERLEHRQERDLSPMRDAPRLVHREAPRPAALRELEAQTALAHPGWRDDADNLARPAPPLR